MTKNISFHIYVRQNDDYGLLAPDNSLVESPADAKSFKFEEIEDAYKAALKEYPNTDHEHSVEIMVYSKESDREFYIDESDLINTSFNDMVEYAINEL